MSGEIPSTVLLEMISLTNTVSLDTKTTTFYASSDPAVERAQDWNAETKTRSDRIHKASGLPLWTVTGELVDVEGAVILAGKLKVASDTEPAITPRGEYALEGSLKALAYVDAKTRAALSFTLVGDLQPSKSGFAPKISTTGN